MLDSDLKHPKAGVRKSDALLLRKIAKSPMRRCQASVKFWAKSPFHSTDHFTVLPVENEVSR